MKRIFSLMRQDLATSLRDNIVVYMILAPILLALAFKTFIPTVESSRLTFAVDRSAGQTVIEKVRRYGAVEVLDRSEIAGRVGRMDAIAGIQNQNGHLSLLLEGNEPEALIETYSIIFDDINRDQPLADYAMRVSGAGRSVLYDFISMMLIMATAFLAGVVAGFNVVDEKDTRTIYALSVSPIRLSEYLASRGLFSTILAVLTGIAASYIMVGSAASLASLVLILIASAALTTLVVLFTGFFAHNQITAVAILKVVMPVYLMLPMLTIFVPERLHFLFYPFPNYWQFEALKPLYAPSLPAHGFWFSILMLVATSVAVLLAAASLFRKRLGLRR